MGDKNNIVEVGMCDVLVKTGHSILKSIYTSQTGDRDWVIRNGVDACGTAVMTVDLVGATSGEISMPYINKPMNCGIFVDIGAGTVGTIVIVFE